MTPERVAIVAGGRTPFVRAGKELRDMGPLALATFAVKELIARHDVDPRGIGALACGVVIPEPGKPNLGREIVLETDLPRTIEAQTISSYCITGIRTVTAVADAIAAARAEAGIAVGAESLSGIDMNVFREPTTGLLMGEHMELTIASWKLPRGRQDEIALASHRRAVAARERLSGEIFPLRGVIADTGPRSDTSLGALAALKPVYSPAGTLTAGNSSPVTDGAAAVLLMGERRARTERREPLAFIRAIEYAAIDPEEGLLMAPAVAVPRLLRRTGVKLSEIDLVEMHEAFAAQVLANALAWETGWKEPSIGPVDWDRVNVSGGSIALGHPWAATGGRIITTLAYEMARRDARYGLASICAAGAMAGAMLLERG